MATPRELEEKFRSALKSDRTMMLGLDGVDDGHARPMTAQLEGERGPIWFFTARDNALVGKLPRGNRAIATFAAKDHDLFATVHGSLAIVVAGVKMLLGVDPKKDYRDKMGEVDRRR